MRVAYYLTCLETGQYIWVGAIGPDGQTIPDVQAGAVSRFALAHRGKPLIVVNDTHPILEEGTEWEAGVDQSPGVQNHGMLE